MLSDPQSITVATVAKSMPRIETSGLSSKYSTSDEAHKMTISHQKSNSRIRSMVRIDQRAVVADPLTAVNDYEMLGVYLIIDRPEVGFSSTAVSDYVTALKDWLTTTNVGKVYGLES